MDTALPVPTTFRLPASFSFGNFEKKARGIYVPDAGKHGVPIIHALKVAKLTYDLNLLVAVITYFHAAVVGHRIRRAKINVPIMFLASGESTDGFAIAPPV